MVIITSILERYGIDAVERALRRVYGNAAHIEMTTDHPGEVWVRPMASLRTRDGDFYRWRRMDDSGVLWICEFYIDSDHGEKMLDDLVNNRITRLPK